MCQIKPCLNTFQNIKYDWDRINHTETAEVYRIQYTDKNSKKGYYIEITQRKNNERLKKHQNDIKNAKSNTAIARQALNENIKFHFKNTKKLSNCNNRTYGYCREAIENKNNRTTCIDAEHFFLEQKW